MLREQQPAKQKPRAMPGVFAYSDDVRSHHHARPLAQVGSYQPLRILINWQGMLYMSSLIVLYLYTRFSSVSTLFLVSRFMKILLPNPTIHVRCLFDSMKSKGCQVDFLVPTYREVPDELGSVPGSKQFRALNERHYLELLDNACQENYDYIFPNYFDDHVLDIASMNERYNMPGISKNAALVLSSKRSYYEKFGELGISFPEPFALIPADETNIEVDNITYPCIVKPTDGTGSSGVRIINNEKELRLFFAKPQLAIHYGIVGRKPRSDYLIQEYIDGTILCPMGHVRNGSVKVDFCQEIINDAGPFFPEKMLAMPAPMSDMMHAIEADLEMFCESIGLDDTAWRCEVVIRDGKYYFIDFGARIGGLNNQMLLEHAGESDYAWKLIDSIFNHRDHALSIDRFAVFKELDLNPGKIKEISCSKPELAGFLHLPKTEVFSSKVDTDIFKNGFAILTGPSMMSCQEKYQQLSESLSVIYEQAPR